jgi:hypothetical protein
LSGQKCKKEFSKIDGRYQRRIKVKLAELDDRSAPRPISKKYRRQKIISGYALAITASSLHFGTIPITCYVLPSNAEHQRPTFMRRSPYGCSANQG